MVRMPAVSGSSGTIAQIKELLRLDPGKEDFAVTSNALAQNPETVAIRTRSIMSILFYLSQTVDVPEEHEAAGLVNVTRNPDGSRFDWGTTPAGRLFGIRQSRRRPHDAFLAVPYRNHWFYLGNDDLNSKSSFMLMSQLFSLNAGTIKSVNPTLTIPVGR